MQWCGFVSPGVFDSILMERLSAIWPDWAKLLYNLTRDLLSCKIT